MLTIGGVVAELSAEFPELRESKVRFLESAGLVTPERTASGYRRYDAQCVERIRTILRLQRDNFWPLKVIGEHLASTEGALPERPVRTSRPMRKASRISGATVQSRSGLDASTFAELLTYGLVVPDADGRYDEGAVEVCETVVALADFGIQPRHLRSSRVAADREVGLANQALAAIDGKGPQGRARRAEALAEVVALLVSLHEGLIRTGLNQS